VRLWEEAGAHYAIFCRPGKEEASLGRIRGRIGLYCIAENRQSVKDTDFAICAGAKNDGVLKLTASHSSR